MIYSIDEYRDKGKGHLIDGKTLDEVYVKVAKILERETTSTCCTSASATTTATSTTSCHTSVTLCAESKQLNYEPLKVTAMKDLIKDYMAQSFDNETEVWQFVNTYLNECYSFQIYTIIDELDDEQLRTIIKHFDL